jgi:hypothetical protein
MLIIGFIDAFQGLIALLGWVMLICGVVVVLYAVTVRWSESQLGLGRNQPLDGSVYWNPNGYEWTGVSSRPK